MSELPSAISPRLRAGWPVFRDCQEITITLLASLVRQDGILQTDCQSVLGSGAQARRADAILPHKADHYLRRLFFDTRLTVLSLDPQSV